MEDLIQLNKDEKLKEKLNEIIEEELAELEKDEIELFDDYLEMVMTFGYITLFAAAFPFGTTLTSLFLYLETKQDCFKISTLCRRPFARKAFDTGVWEITLDLFTFSSIFTNLILACFASNQIDAIIPMLKNYGNGSWVELYTEFAVEHFLLFLVIALRIAFNSDPAWLATYKKRKNHQEEVKQLTESKIKRHQLVMAFIKKQIANRFSTNGKKRQEWEKARL